MSTHPTPPERTWHRANLDEPALPTNQTRWRAQSEPSSTPPRYLRKGRILLLFLGLFVLCALVVWVSLWFRPGKDTALVLLVAGYEDNLALPHNVYGRQGLVELAALGRDKGPSWGGGRLRLPMEPRPFTDVDGWEKNLNNLQQKTVLLFFSAHGGADGEGAYLLPDGALQPSAADPLEPNTRRLRLTRILERLKRLPRQRHIVLVLDATQMNAHWPLGMLHNNFAKELEKLDAQIADMPNLIVLSASADNQRSWSSPELRKTIFAHFFIKGLQGAADANDDGRVNAEELYQYVSAKVPEWVRRNRAAAQTPVLLPSGERGKERARSMHLTVVTAEPATTLEKNPVFVPKPDLVRAWQKFSELEQRRPAPEVYAPALWTQYQQALLRYEELAQAGAEAAQRIMGNRLVDLEQQIVQAAALPLNSMQNSLAMPLVSGVELPSAKTVLPAFTELWDAPAKEREKKWAALLAKAGPDKLSKQLLRLKLCDLLLERLNEAPTAHLDQVAAMLHLMDDPLNPRPTEAHFAVMLQRDLPRQEKTVRLPADLLRLALRVRSRGERAALGAPDTGTGPPKVSLYVEQLQPWLRASVAEADAQRRLGEDLLFATETANWDTGRAQLEAAERLYRQAQERASKVRSALATRDRVLVRLPALTQWAARHMGSAETAAAIKDAEQTLEQVRDPGQVGKFQLAAIKDAEQTLEQVEQAWRSVHLLASTLELPHRAKAVTGDAQLLQLLERGTEAQDGLDRLEKAYQAAREEEDKLPPQMAWRHLDDLLSVPAGPAKDRVELLIKKSRISYNLLNDRVQAVPTLPTATVQDKMARRAAEAQGRMALALLGQQVFQEIDAREGDSYQTVADRLAVLPQESKWQTPAAAVGAQIGRRWQGLPKEIHVRLARAAKANSAQALLDLQGAERFARQLDASGSLVVPQSPVEKYRKALVKELLLSQGQRTLLDHWFAENAAREPYYRAAGRLYLSDVGRHDGAKPLQQRLNQEQSLQIVLDGAPSLPKGPGEATLHITSEEVFPVRFRLQVQGELAAPVGNPVVWVEAGANLNVSQPQQGWRLVMPGGVGLLPTLVTSDWLREAEFKPPTKPSALSTTLTVQGLYRGQRLQQITPIQLHPLAQTIVTSSPTPTLASLAVRAGKVIHDQFGTSKGAVAIVLDCSGSMGALPNQAKETSKFFEAAAAVRQLLQRVPKGTRLSLWVFGQAVGLGKTANRAEDTIEPLLPATTWNPDDAQAIDGLMSKITDLQPWNESPIVRTMYRAAREHLDKTDGYKTMIVITDGMDNRLDKDAELNPQQKTVATFLLEQFKDIEVNVIGFKIVSQEEKQAREQFEVVTKLPNRGQFFLVDESRDLFVKMTKLLPQKLTYDLFLDDNRPKAAVVARNLTISRDPANDRWLQGGLNPGNYQVSVVAKNATAQSIQLDRGDLLLMEVGADKAGKLGYRRLLFSEADYPWKLAKEKAGWRLAVLQNQRVPASGLQMLFALEKQGDTQGATLRQWTPAKTWIEVTPPPDVKTPVSRRWHYQPNYPAPVWSLESPEWPGTGSVPAVRPTVRAWWAPTAPALVGNSLERGKHFQHLKDINDLPLTVDAEQVIVESVTLERHLVEIQPGVGDPTNRRQLQSCLVVRLSHPPSHPVWVELRGLTVKGQEHRYYSSAGKYTALFWPVSPDQAATVLKGLEVYSLPAFKRDAEQRGFMVEIPNLYDPQASDVRPLPPLLLPGARLSEGPFDVNAPLTEPVPERNGPGMLPPPRLFAPPSPRLFAPPVLAPQLQSPALTPLPAGK